MQTMNPHIEVIRGGDAELAYVVRASWAPDHTEFVTPDHFGLQMGAIVYPKGGDLPAHVHLPITREVQGTTEVLIVRRGECEVHLYTSQREFVTSRRLHMGDIILLLGGGHGFHMHEDTVLFEVKQGPYAGGRDKERF
jgi:hypothetical protein